jgi:hypothetical protein
MYEFGTKQYLFVLVKRFSVQRFWVQRLRLLALVPYCLFYTQSSALNPYYS